MPQSFGDVCRAKGPTLLPIVVFLACMAAGCAPSKTLFRERSGTGLPREGKTFGGTLFDADGDGRLDLFLSRHTHTPQLLRSQSRLRFVNCRPSPPWPALVDEHGAAAFDVDADGIEDVYVTVGAGQGTTEGFNALWRGGPSCAFESAADAPPFLSDPRGRGRGALWMDLAGDRRPDLLVFNQDTPARLFSLEPDGWRDRTEELPPYPASRRGGPSAITKGDRAPRHALHTACAGDLDGDGRPELFVSGTQNLLLGTDARGRLRDQTEAAGLEVDNGFVADAEMADLDADGDLDLVVAYRGDVGVRAWMNESAPGALRLTRGPALEGEPLRPWSIALEDLDNDGFVDLYVARLGPDQTNLPNQVLRGEGDGSFTPRPEWGAVADVFSGSTGAWAVDLDHDGDLDLLALQGAGPSDTQPGGVLLYENRAPRGGVTVDLVSTRGAIHALGARAFLRGATARGHAWVRPVAAPYNSFTPRLHFGVGDDVGPFELQIFWPDGQEQTVTIAKARAAYRVREGDNEAERLP